MIFIMVKIVIFIINIVFDFLNGQIKKNIYRMKYKIDKKYLINRIRQK